MKERAIERTIAELREGKVGEGVHVLKRSRVRVVARLGDAFLKLFLRPGRRPRREARAIRRAKDVGLPVPELLATGSDWIATRWVEGRAATRQDLPAILEVVDRMHGAGLLHRDLHLGNLIATPSGIVVTDLQRAIFLPRVPHLLRRRELGWLAYSLGEPLPEELAHVRFWCDLRARRHLASRTRRCVTESGVFTRFRSPKGSGFRRREVDPLALSEVLTAPETHECLKDHPSRRLFRARDWILKEHRSAREARRAWINGHGLEVRGIRTGRGVAWAGRWVVMEDAGATVTDWVESEFEGAPPPTRAELCDALADVLADLHRRGIYHADLKANNFAWAPGAPPRLLDYGRVSFRRSVSTRRRIKNLAQLNAALPDVLPSALRERAFERYAERSALRGDREEVRRRTIELSLRRAHRWHGC